MFDCNNLLHPFQHDPGVSQNQRIRDNLLSDAPKIDGRKMADLLDYFVQLSRHINYYDSSLNISDWKPFFQKSIPFLLATIIKYDQGFVTEKIKEYSTLFEKRASGEGLQLLVHYMFYQVIDPINTWHLQLKGSDLPAELITAKLIKDKLQGPVEKFICYHNVAVKNYCIKAINFLPLSQNEIWGLNKLKLHTSDCAPDVETKRKRLIALYDEVKLLLPAFLDAIRIIAGTSEQSMEQSFFPLKEELQKKHTPHLALLFAFLKLFQYLQGDLNSFTKKHLDFFYKEVLRLKAKNAVPDKAHLVFEIQKQLDTYLLQKGLLAKDGKDTNNAEILFSLDDEIVVNKAQVADKRTLFLNNKNILEKTYLEGVYMAPDAGKADGVSESFKEGGATSFPTFGAKLSKYTDPEKSLPKPYPNARLGFILASPVLLLNEGERTIDITLACKLDPNLCEDIPEASAPSLNNCCEDEGRNNVEKGAKKENKYEDFVSSKAFYEDVSKALVATYYYVSEDRIVDAVKKGIGKALEGKLRKLLQESTKLCYCPSVINNYDRVLPEEKWKSELLNAKNDSGELILNDSEKTILKELFGPRKALNILFSGEKKWIEPTLSPSVSLEPSTSDNPVEFLLKITAKLHANQPAVTFYNKETLKEDFNTTLPLVKIELDEKIKLALTDKDLKEKISKTAQNNDCLLLKSSFFCITQAFIDDLDPSLSDEAKAYLTDLLTKNNDIIKIGKSSQDCFLDAKKEDTGLPVFNENDKKKIKKLVNDPSKNHCPSTLQFISLYHFFRNVTLTDKVDATQIEVNVCGLKNLIVQNDESVQDVNAPIYPFGTRPKVPDANLGVICITQELIDDAVAADISSATENYLDSILGTKKLHRLNSKLGDFLNSIPDVNDKPILKSVFNSKNYCNRNPEGPNFYIGSKEVFSKNWQEVFVNTEWKDKPKDFGVHYKHYSYKNTTFEDGSKEIVNSSFLTTAAVLDNGHWIPDGQRRLFKPITDEQARIKPLPSGFPDVPSTTELPASFCNHPPLPDHLDVYDYTKNVFLGLSAYERKQDFLTKLEPYNVSSKYGFLRFTLEGISFQHEIFPFVLTRQMMAYAGLLSLDVIQEMVTKADQMKKIIVAMISDINEIKLHIVHIQTDLGNLNLDITTIKGELNHMEGDLNQALANPFSTATEIGNAQNHINNIRQALDSLASSNDIQDVAEEIQEEINRINHNLSDDLPLPFEPDNADDYGLERLSVELDSIIDFFVDNLQVDPELKDGLPSEPYTPIIKSLSLDYKATAENTDIDLIHLHPYKNTYKHEEITLQPCLFPTFCDEGNLFIGLQDLVPGNNLNILFQLAEATADSESQQEEVNWYYLDNNQWKPLRTGFEILDEATNGLTASGIIKFALPENMTKENTILPKGLYWIKASIPKNSRSVCETIGIHTQAISSTFTSDPKNDKSRLSIPLTAGKINRLLEANAAVKKLTQPYDSFGGRVPEAKGHFYVRVSELLRHKGRGIQKFDYERLALEAFPQLFKVKCINHSFALNAHQFKNDFPISPGYVVLGVIPDLNRLKADRSLEPRVPVSILENIAEYMQERISPFVRFRAMNPRYEKVNFCLKVKLMPGKDENYYKEKLKRDIRELLAPWSVGKYDKLSFGQCVNRSDIVRLLETNDYVDFISELRMEHQENTTISGLSEDSKTIISVCPKTPRSILIAGDIDVCIPKGECPGWNENEKLACFNTAKPIADYCIKPKEVIR